MQERKGFFGGIWNMLGKWFGVKEKTNAVIESPETYKRLLGTMKSMAPGGWSEDHWAQTRLRKLDRGDPWWKSCRDHVEKKWNKRGPKLERPNKGDTLNDLLDQLTDQVFLTGIGLVWTVPNKLGEIFEAYVLPTAIAIPHPAKEPEFPDGFYRVHPPLLYGACGNDTEVPVSVGTIIGAEWVFKVYAQCPLLMNHEKFREVEGMVNPCINRRQTNPHIALQFTDANNYEPLDDTELGRIKRQFEEEYNKTDGRGRLFVSPPGTELKTLGSCNCSDEVEGLRKIIEEAQEIDKKRYEDFKRSWNQIVSFVQGKGYGGAGEQKSKEEFVGGIGVATDSDMEEATAPQPVDNVKDYPGGTGVRMIDWHRNLSSCVLRDGEIQLSHCGYITFLCKYETVESHLEMDRLLREKIPAPQQGYRRVSTKVDKEIYGNSGMHKWSWAVNDVAIRTPSF